MKLFYSNDEGSFWRGTSDALRAYTGRVVHNAASEARRWVSLVLNPSYELRLLWPRRQRRPSILPEASGLRAPRRGATRVQSQPSANAHQGEDLHAGAHLAFVAS